MATRNRGDDPSSSGTPSSVAVFAPNGEYWTTGYLGKTFSLKASKGLAYIHRLLQHPGEEFHALDLLSGPGTAFIPESATAETSPNSGLTIGRLGDAGEMLDSKAKQDYKRRLVMLREEMEDARELGNTERAAKIESEIDFLAREISRAIGLGGRDRRAGSAAERARLNVTRAIKTALQKISEHNAELGKLLDRGIRTGSFCSYAADQRLSTNWQLYVEGLKPFVDVESTAPFLLKGDTSLLRSLVDRTMFVGRSEELATLRRVLDQAVSGKGKTVMIGGPPGVGKSRLAVELAADSAQKGILTLVGACYDRDDAVPFSPFVEILEAALAQAPSSEAFRQALGQDVAEISRIIPQLRRIFPDIAQPLEVSPDQSRRILFNAILQLITRSARNLPAVLLLEDLHWADEGTLSLFSYLSRSISNLAVMVVGTYRDNELNPAGLLAKTLDEMIRLRLVDRMHLRGLSLDAAAEMIRALSGREPPGAVVTLIHSNTEGNPFFIEELFQHLVERGKLIDANGEFRRNLELDDVEVPQSVRLVIERRLARLRNETRKTLASAAIIGRSFTFELLVASSHMGEDALLDHVEEAERAGLISSSLEYPETRFQFSHELIRQHILADLSAPRRQRLHVNVADAIERVYARTLADHIDDLAHHLWKAGRAADTDKTIEYLTMAAKRALHQSASREAEERYRQALAVLETTPGTPERDRKELVLQLQRGGILRGTKGFGSPETGNAYARARDLCNRIGEKSALTTVLNGLYSYHLVRDELDLAGNAADELLTLAKAQKDRTQQMIGHRAVGAVLLHRGVAGAALDELDKSLALYDPLEHGSHAFLYGADHKEIASSFRGLCLWMLGYPDQARDCQAKAVADAETLKHSFTIAQSLTFHSFVLIMARDFESARGPAQRLFKLSSEQSFQLMKASASFWLGIIRAMRESLDEGLEDIVQATRIWWSTESVQYWPYAQTVIAEIYSLKKSPQQGLRFVQEAKTFIERTNERWTEAELHRVEGDLLMIERRDAEAEVSFRRAIEIAQRQGARSWELRATIALSRMLARANRLSEVRGVLEPIYNSFVEGFETVDLKAARSILDEL